MKKRPEIHNPYDEDRKLGLERLVFFSDAVLAIALTLLALDLQIPNVYERAQLGFADLLPLWPKFAAFLLSFLQIAAFWMGHHQFFNQVRGYNSSAVWINTFWLLTVVVLPFSATLISAHFGEVCATAIYTGNALLMALMQSWMVRFYVARPHLLDPDITKMTLYAYRVFSNTLLGASILAFLVAFVSPVAAIVVLFIRPLINRMIFLRLLKMEQAGIDVGELMG